MFGCFIKSQLVAYLLVQTKEIKKEDKRFIEAFFIGPVH